MDADAGYPYDQNAKDSIPAEPRFSACDIITFIGIAVLTVIPLTAVGHAIGLASLPGEYFSWLAAITLAYMLLATMMKKLYIKRYGEIL